MENKYLFAILLVTSLFFFACKKKATTCDFAATPPLFFFQLKKNGQPLGSDTLKNIKLGYFDNGIKNYVSDLAEAIGPYINLGILGTRNRGIISSTKATKTFYLEYSNGIKTDTLLIDYPTVSIATDCVYFLKQV